MDNRGDTPARDALILLGRAIGFQLADAELTDLRLTLMRDRRLWSRLFDEAGEHRLTSVLIESAEERGLLPPPGSTAGAMLRELWREHVARRQAMRAGLIEIVTRLNAAGIEPLILKGAQSLWTGVPRWRFLRDIDLLVHPHEAEVAQAELLAMGYSPDPAAAERPSHHHLALLFRDDFPGWVEVHRKAANRYAERFLPTRRLHEAATADTLDGARARLLPAPIRLAHALLHHHVGHSAYARGTLGPKGLYEFAAEIVAMDESERHAFVALVRADPRFSAMLDLYTAAAATLFAMPVEAPLRLTDDATARVHAILGRLDRPSTSKYPGYGEEIAMAFADTRLAEAGGTSMPARLVLRLSVLASLLPALPGRAGDD